MDFMDEVINYFKAQMWLLRMKIERLRIKLLETKIKFLKRLLEK